MEKNIYKFCICLLYVYCIYLLLSSYDRWWGLGVFLSDDFIDDACPENRHQRGVITDFWHIVLIPMLREVIYICIERESWIVWKQHFVSFPIFQWIWFFVCICIYKLFVKLTRPTTTIATRDCVGMTGFHRTPTCDL